ncbi:MAG: glutaredoxin family protein [Verrucomicrobia bacterium]|nr:glutaredoxin family protein [Verrucomicrobiota bacterium]
MKIRLFIKPYCPWCVQAVEWLEARRLPYERLDVTTSATAYHEMIALSHQTLAPVIEVDGQVLADFDTGQLETFWKQHGLAS